MKYKQSTREHKKNPAWAQSKHRNKDGKSIRIEEEKEFKKIPEEGSTMTLRSTHPLTEMSSRNLPWGIKAAGA
jgi:hypothetical protein